MMKPRVYSRRIVYQHKLLCALPQPKNKTSLSRCVLIRTVLIQNINQVINFLEFKVHT